MSTDAGAVAAGDSGLDRAEVERQLHDDAASALADELREQWEDDQRAVILADDGRQEWYWKDVAITAASERSATAVLVATGGGTDVLPREDAIALRDFLTRAIEGTLPPYEDHEPTQLGDGEEPF